MPFIGQMMFDSPIEWAIIVLVILVLFGTKKLPEFARNLGRATGEYSRGKMELEREIRDSMNKTSTAPDNKVVDAAKALGIETSNKDETTLKNEIAEKVKTAQ